MNRTIVLVNNTGSDIRPYEGEILAALKSNGALPEELADLFTVTRLDDENADGSPRFVLRAA